MNASALEAQPIFDDPCWQAERIGSIEAGDILTAIYGVVCSEDTVWWGIQTPDTVQGFIAESRQDTYLLEPA
jgi:hypothetical protein